jgi:hypothetical protein
MWDAIPHGAPASPSRAAAGVTGATAGGVKAACTESKLHKIEASTVGMGDIGQIYQSVDTQKSKE